MDGFGDLRDIEDDYDDSTFRLYFHNICGLKVKENTHNSGGIIGFLQSFRASAVCFAETNVNWRCVDSG